MKPTFTKSTFKEVAEKHNFDLSSLAHYAEVSYDCISKLLLGEPVSIKETRSILRWISLLSGKNYTPENMDIRTEGSHE